MRERKCLEKDEKRKCFEKDGEESDGSIVAISTS